jgi:hypothetical protein
MKSGENTRYILGGKPFVILGESTLEHDDYIAETLHRGAISRFDQEPDESHEDFSHRIESAIAGSGVGRQLLGAALVPEGMTGAEWKPALAEETAQHLATITDPSEKALARSLQAAFILDFFRRGLIVLRSSKNSSEPSQPENPSTTLSRDAAGGLVLSGSSPSTMANGRAE